MVMKRTIFEEEHELFRSSFRQFLDKELLPRNDEFEKAGIVDRAVFAAAGASGFLGYAVPEEFGGGGVDDFRYAQVILEEFASSGANAAGLGISLHNDICLPYFLHSTTEEQKARWLPGLCSGELISAVAMTEPGAGSDLAGIRATAIRDGDHYVVNGSKTFITNGINADLVIVAVKTDPTQRHGGMSLIIIERGMEGFERGRNLDKIGLHAQDTAELFFNDVRVPVENLLDAEGTGFQQLVRNLAQERLSIAVGGMAVARTAFDLTLAYCKEREAFGQPIGGFQNTRMQLAQMKTEVEVTQAFVDQCVLARNSGDLTVEEAAMAKLWCTELQGRMTDMGVQLHGGYGYMTEYLIGRLYADARVTRIYGGTNEIMRDLVGKSLLRG
jgi:alkylation response protein AidB-like acyl-CoA dehydrogenase